MWQREGEVVIFCCFHSGQRKLTNHRPDLHSQPPRSTSSFTRCGIVQDPFILRHSNETSYLLLYSQIIAGYPDIAFPHRHYPFWVVARSTQKNYTHNHTFSKLQQLIRMPLLFSVSRVSNMTMTPTKSAAQAMPRNANPFQPEHIPSTRP